MAPVRNSQLLFKEWPGDGYPIVGKTLVYDDTPTIDLDTVSLDGGILLKMLVLSVDPYLRRRMVPNVADFIITSFELGAPVVNFGVGVVLRSESPQFKPGDHVTNFFPFQEYVVQKDTTFAHVIHNKEGLPWSAYLGLLGLPGETAWYAWEEYAKPQKGDVVFVSAASGAVGSIVVQLAKAAGLKVIGSAGTDEKVAYVASLGADVAFNYKSVPTKKVLEKEGPINIYWDNVGGETLETALEHSAQQARFIICGSISSYNTLAPYGVKNLQLLVWREVHLYGFLKTRLEPKYSEEFFRTVPPRVAKGELKYKETVVRGLENAAQAIVDIQKGENFGKSIVIVADE